MTPEEYAERMHQMQIGRGELVSGITPFYGVREIHESAYLPGGEDKSIIPLPPTDISEDLSAMNSKQWKTLKARGKTTGRPRKS